VSPRVELYPGGMDALRSLKLAQAGLAGLRQLTVEDLRRRVEERYPEAAHLPDRPELDEMLSSAGFSLRWDESQCAYVVPAPPATPSSESLQRLQTVVVTTPPALRPLIEQPPDVAEARDFEDLLRNAYHIPSYLVLATAPKFLRDSERELRNRFPMDVVNLEAELIRSMREQAERLGVDWSVVLRADAADPDSPDNRRLRMLVQRSIGPIEERLARRQRNVLLTYPGLLARYGQVAVLDRLRDQTRDAGLWVLIATDEQTGPPTLDGAAIPALGASQWARVPRPWLENKHRGGQG
ncbi:MAG: hypothetical protein AAB654_03545, partial [Acidobacteriota bacterium]